MARVDGEELSFGHVNEPGSVHRLPAAVLATVCGHVAGTATHELTAEQLRRAVGLLAPAEAATHWEHPNLWSWRELLRDAAPASRFVAFFVADPDEPPADGRDAAFRERLRSA